jgi:2-dehydro-3-deoxygalactonokinase
MDQGPVTRDKIGVAIALDGGTTTTRARLIQAGRIVASAVRQVGIRDAVLAGLADPLVRAVGACVDEVRRVAGAERLDRIVAAGMLTSEVGLVAVPHVEAPAGRDDLARAVVVREVPGLDIGPIAFVPGVRTPVGDGPDGWAEVDLMRGEESETIGVLEEFGIAGPTAFLWPGSHTKLVLVDEHGRICRSQTTLAGELTSVVAQQTILAASLVEGLPDDPDPDALAAGARLADREGLGRAAFLVRVAALVLPWGPRQRAAFWIGAVIGADVAQLARHPILAGGIPVFVGGRQPQRRLYTEALAGRHPGPVVALGDETAEHASAIGALAIAGGWRF